MLERRETEQERLLRQKAEATAAVSVQHATTQRRGAAPLFPCPSPTVPLCVPPPLLLIHCCAVLRFDLCAHLLVELTVERCAFQLRSVSFVLQPHRQGRKTKREQGTGCKQCEAGGYISANSVMHETRVLSIASVLIEISCAKR